MNSNAYRPTEPLIDEVSIAAREVRRVAPHTALWGTEASRAPRPTSLSPSLLAELDRFERKAEGADPLEVLAACIRHARPLVVILEIATRLLSLRLYPLQGLFVCPADFLDLTEDRLQQLKVVRVQPGHPHQEPVPGTADATERTGSLTLLAWQLAMVGGRFELLPEIAGRACYRVSRATDLNDLPIDDAATGLLRRMQRDNLALDDIAAVPGVGFERACRLVNAVYLQGGLITLRFAPASRLPKARAAPAAGSR